MKLQGKTLTLSGGGSEIIISAHGIERKGSASTPHHGGPIMASTSGISANICVEGLEIYYVHYLDVSARTNTSTGSFSKMLGKKLEDADLKVKINKKYAKHTTIIKASSWPKIPTKFSLDTGGLSD